jgi:hypothetical protein
MLDADAIRHPGHCRAVVFGTVECAASIFAAQKVVVRPAGGDRRVGHRDEPFPARRVVDELFATNLEWGQLAALRFSAANPNRVARAMRRISRRALTALCQRPSL